ncbi:hypothetical protein BGX30_012651 [Mortierella sp. GBA39]|nr:hypothetical protein BGX30_012651 [Mortierella sp. GBA39]
MLPRVAELMGLSTASETSLWRDRALVEMNVAVLHSYKQAGVSMVDHHTAASQFRLALNTIHLNEIIRELVGRSGLGVQVRLRTRSRDGRLIGGKYGMVSKRITMYTGVIEEQCMQMFGSLDRVEEYFTIVLAHELGHAADPELPALSESLEDMNLTEEQRMRVALQIEENAWNYALELIPEADLPMMSAIIDESLYAYRLQVEEAGAEAGIA